MKRLSLEEMLLIHFHIICDLQEENKNYTVCDYSAVEMIAWNVIAQPRKRTVFTHLCRTAADITWNITSKNPFKCGNVGAGITAGCVFMMINNCRIIAPEADMLELVKKTVEREWHKEEIAKWFEDNSILENNPK